MIGLTPTFTVASPTMTGPPTNGPDYSAHFEAGRPVSDQVIEAIEDSGLGDPSDPLYSSIDLDALDDLFSDRSPRLDGRLTFVFDALEITVVSGGQIWIREIEE